MECTACLNFLLRPSFAFRSLPSACNIPIVIAESNILHSVPNIVVFLVFRENRSIAIPDDDTWDTLGVHLLKYFAPFLDLLPRVLRRRGCAVNASESIQGSGCQQGRRWRYRCDRTRKTYNWEVVWYIKLHHSVKIYLCNCIKRYHSSSQARTNCYPYRTQRLHYKLQAFMRTSV